MAVCGGDLGPGGRHQRAKRLHAEEAVGGEESSLVKHLVREWAWGHTSAVQVQTLALHSYRDQCSLLKKIGLSDDHATKDLRSLAKLGSWGKHTGNCAKQLKMFLGEASVPPPMMREVPLSMGKRAQSGSAGDEVDVVSHVELPIFLPHVSFSWYYHNDKARFNELYMGVCASTDDIVHFWTELLRRGDPRLAEHSMKHRRNWKSQALPIALHGDAVPVLSVGKANPKSFDTYSIQGVFFCRGRLYLSSSSYSVCGRTKSQSLLTRSYGV